MNGSDEQGSAATGGDTRARLLRRSFLFREVQEEMLTRVAAIAVLRTLDPEETLFWQGDEADALYGVAEGLVRIWVHGPDGKELTLNLMEPGDFFGEIALLDGLPRTATAGTLMASRLIAIPRRDFLALLDREPALARHMIELLCERLRESTDRLRDAVFLDLGTRLAKTLQALATAHGREEAAGVVIEAKLSQGALAQLLGVTREAVNKQLKVFEREGLVARVGTRLAVCDLAAMKQRARPQE